ncbi:oligogalacturonate lyase family protein [Thermasporomyces composti]|uniref:Oligogalacturonide lyase n=1 Tax=Thermasporomyces composti TaxID=696763 RepID=A0A3D9V4I2_THECX|nr:oligogalacturonate lyase family protein [Thermasporomyces composti]REF36276.1 oligogalacturonide lyase [Thermasporomyces composti]
MAKGDLFGPEWHEVEDLTTGVKTLQLTDHKAHSHHLYFTNSGWYDDNQQLLFGSDRGGSSNLYSLDLRTGEYRQLTDLEEPPGSGSGAFQSTSVNPVRPEAYFWWRNTLVAIDLETLEERTLYTVPDGFHGGGQTNVTADGAYVCVNIGQDLSDRIPMDLGAGYVGMREYWAAKPRCQIVRVPTDGGEPSVVWEEDSWIGHVNTSPTRPNLLTFCHEGPWHLVDHRIWMLDLDTGEVWKLRPTAPNERVGHEYWFADGEHVGYHGWTEGGSPFHGAVRYDNTTVGEYPLSHTSTHFHSNDLNLIVGDGNRDRPFLLLWRLTEHGYEGPRVLLRHRGSFHIQAVHVHPRVSPDGRQILYTSDPRGYGNPYLVEIPDVETLPLLEEVEQPRS